MTQDRPIVVSVQEPIHPNVRLVARACIEVAKMRIQDEKLQQHIINKVRSMEPEILFGERFGFEALILKGNPIIVFFRGTVACKFVGKLATALVSTGLAEHWRIPGEKLPRSDWLLLDYKLSEHEVLDIVEKTVVQAGLGVSG